MRRALFILISLIITETAMGQTMSAAEAVKNYTIDQKRLLMVNTAQFANLLAQNNLDKDSVMVIASEVTGLPLLLAYSEGFADENSQGTDLINAGKIAEAEQLLNQLTDYKKIRLLVELAVWWLHQPGNHKKDLDSANFYIDAASRLGAAGKFNKWKNECQFLLAESSLQKGDTLKSKKIISEMINFGLQNGRPELAARAYQQLCSVLPKIDSSKIVYYQKSYELYRKLELKEKQIEVLWEIATCHLNSDLNLMGQDLDQILFLMRSSGFRHELYIQNIIAYVAAARAKYIDALKHANNGLDNVKWSGIIAVSGAFYIRMGAIYGLLGKTEVALIWFKKALESGTNYTHLFWYKSLFFASELLNKAEKPEESLLLTNTITSKFPPITVWENIQVLSLKGYSYEKLKQFKLADLTYMALFNLKKKYPEVDTYGELMDTYEDIINFYISQGDLEKSNLFLNLAVSTVGSHFSDYGTRDELFYRLDSLKGNFKSALQHHIRYKLYYDSLVSIDQRIKFDDLTIQYASAKKDQDIKLLKQQGILHQVALEQNKNISNIMIAGSLLLLFVVALLFSRFKLKQRTNIAMNKKNTALQHLVEEKEWLLKEVHHRVKNNLHTVISLLESQAAYLKNDALKAIENSQHRIYAMSLIHQKLYQAEDVKTIDMAVYTPEFVRYLRDSFGTEGKIRFLLNIESLKLGVGQAIPVALIINEAVTNAIKYAFPQKEYGTIEISIRKNDNQVFLSIADNGIGMTMLQKHDRVDSLGLKLLKGLSEDINGLMNIIVENGTSINICFPEDLISDCHIITPNINKDVYA